MINIVNKSIEYLYDQIKSKRLFMFGAGKRAQYLCDTYHLESQIEAIIDNNSSLIGQKKVYGKKEIKIISFETFCNIMQNEEIENVILLVSALYSAWTIIEQLDAVKELNGLNCYLGRLIDDCIENQKFDFTMSKQLIPKKIHYCWFGRNPIPEHLLKYIESWKKYCPDYEIVRWDESNYDVNKVNYMKQAYERKKWGFVPDYARLDIIYQEGGVYLDTDVELISTLDKLLCDQMFCGFASARMINLGLGFGACKGNEFIKELRDVYDDYNFIDNNGKENLIACSWYEHPIFEKYHFEIDGKYQKRNGIVAYPPEVLNPLGASTVVSNFTPNTVSIHHAELSWVTSKEKIEFERFKENIRARIS